MQTLLLFVENQVLKNEITKFSMSRLYKIHVLKYYLNNTMWFSRVPTYMARWFMRLVIIFIFFKILIYFSLPYNTLNSIFIKKSAHNAFTKQHSARFEFNNYLFVLDLCSFVTLTKL